METIKRGPGKPLKYKPDEMEQLINEYLNKGLIIENGIETYSRPITISGLCCYLDIDRQMLNRYKVKPDYSDSIERAYRKILAYTEEQLYRSQGQVNGIIFNLKNNWGWKDQTETTVKTETGPDLSSLTTNEIKALLKPGAADQVQELEQQPEE